MALDRTHHQLPQNQDKAGWSVGVAITSCILATARAGLLIGAAVGIVLPLLEMRFPARRAWIPSATGVGLAFTTPGFNCVSMFLGGLFGLWLGYVRPRLAEEYVIPVSSGVIAGESLMGLLIALLTVKGWLG